ncbi:hypothetical protein CTAYLR_001564 [Chrysophaeum taylorii]|uniref:Selenoprotein W-like protein n=1 Tax=Chrysophaeum taylorii TaxID=2483200 RepID=A0AAD7XLU4_9STRA|nr:hypothetical protein CTAYLR_001564 [Chrysophaeum taylorii]
MSILLFVVFARAFVSPSNHHKIAAARVVRHATEGASVRIKYCTGCRWMLRSAYFAQEILSTFDDGSVREVTLAPQYASGGEWVVEVGEEVVWDRRRDGGFPQVPELKQRIRDVVAPDQHLGHSDTTTLR